MKLREHHLIQCKFIRKYVTAEESGGEPYYYYTYDLSKNNLNFCLISSTSDNTPDGNWTVSFLEVDDYLITTYEDLLQVFQTFKYIKKQ